MILYDYILSPNCYKVRLMAALIGKEITLRPGDFHPGIEHKSEALLPLNPAGSIPILTDGELVLTESAAMLAYLAATLAVYILATLVALLRSRGVEEAAVEAQCSVIGNVGILGVPMLVLLLGEAAIGPVLLVLAVDLIVFGSLIVILITGSRDGRMSLGILRTVGLGLLKNPMIVSITTGLIWSAFALPIPKPVNEFLSILGAAATPGALFAIGASLASKSAERVSVAVWLSLCKLVLHPAAVAVAALIMFPVAPSAAGVLIAAAALPVEGYVFILAQHYGVAPQRVSATILISTVASVVTVSGVVAWVSAL